jgi:hypothetical protein
MDLSKYAKYVQYNVNSCIMACFLLLLLALEVPAPKILIIIYSKTSGSSPAKNQLCVLMDLTLDSLSKGMICKLPNTPANLISFIFLTDHGAYKKNLLSSRASTQ